MAQQGDSKTPTRHTPQPPPHARNPAYREVEVIKDPDGVIAVISEHVETGAHSFAIYREITRSGEAVRTAYMSRRHLPAVTRLLPDLEERIEQLEDRARAKRRDRDR
ncbi:MAG TPA: hypothetical protein VFD36_29535 [Kofleriaceae bacterium]|nr:hypothetical protein [Kofleriaceae bacterium]